MRMYGKCMAIGKGQFHVDLFGLSYCKGGGRDLKDS